LSKIYLAATEHLVNISIHFLYKVNLTKKFKNGTALYILDPEP
jgi:hypothetical protein